MDLLLTNYLNHLLNDKSLDKNNDKIRFNTKAKFSFTN